MYKKLFHIISILFASIIIAFPVRSQELDPTVDVNLQNMSSDVKDRLTNFKQDVTDYLTRTRFTDEDVVNDVKGKPYKIKCNFQIFFTATTGFDSYEAQVVVIAQRNVYRTQNYTTILRIKDESWAFNYTRGQSFYHDELRFNPLTSFLDYYAYMIIGMDDDSWELNLGTKRFQKAQDVVNLAVASNSTKGWTDITSAKATRSSYPAELLNSKYDNFRKAFWIYHFAGIDSLQYDKRQALDRMAQAIDMIGKVKKNEVRSFIIKAFFDAKYQEIAQTMVDYYDKMIYRRLDDIDPDHVSTYDEYRLK
jgi:hypothetical protein